MLNNINKRHFFLKSGYRIEIVSKIKTEIIWKNCILDMINFDFDWLTSLIKDYKPTPIPILTIANGTCSPDQDLIPDTKTLIIGIW